MLDTGVPVAKRKGQLKKSRTPARTAPKVPAEQELPIDLENEQDPSVLRAHLAALMRKNAELQARHDELARHVAYLRRLLWGRRSEKLTAEELGQLVLAFGGTEEQAATADPTVPTPPRLAEEELSEDADQGKKRKHPGRTRLSPSLERIVGAPVHVPESERRCKACHAEMTAIGFVEHERVEYVPAKFVVHVEQREKLVCKACRGDAVTAERQAPAGVRRVGSSVLAHLVESKCDDALPIHRQRDQFSRLGFDVPANTLYSYWAYVTDLLRPVAETTLSCVLGDPAYVALDDTSLKVLDKSKGAGSYRGHLWCFSGTTPLVAYAFTETWKAAEVAPWIQAIEAAIQCDDYKGYSSPVRTPSGEELGPLVPPERRLGCLMHVRRRFHEALKLGDNRATEPLAWIQRLYEIEALARERGLNADERLALRTEKSLPLLAAFEASVDSLLSSTTPSSALGSAVRYAEQQRPFLRRCFTDGRFEIDNGKVERMIREPAIGRNNFLFTGSADGAKRLAAAYTLVQSCRNLGFGAREYLIDVIDKLEAGWPMRRIVELVPDRWALARGMLTQIQ